MRAGFFKDLLAEPDDPHSFAPGMAVQTRSGGAVMVFEGWTEAGEAVCNLNGKRYHVPGSLLRCAGAPAPRRLQRGRPVKARGGSQSAQDAGTPHLHVAPGRVFTAAEIQAMKDGFAQACERLGAWNRPDLQREIAIAIMRSSGERRPDDENGS